jgi:hypothetical protein
LADCSARRVHLEKRPKDWASWNESMHLDTPNRPIINLAKALKFVGNAIVLCTGREEAYREVTSKWMDAHGVEFDDMYMRADKDYRGDDEIKAEMYEAIIADGYEPWLAVDDRSRVVATWRAKGLTCAQIADGNF